MADRKGKAFSFKASTADIERWRLYAAVSGVQISDFAKRALDDYISAHPLTGEQKQKYTESQQQALKEL